jgi:two-component system, cell cycle response regulator
MPARVLVVDDVEVNVRLLEAKLSGEYFNVLSAFNGFAALEIAEAELPDVILLDVMMPRMDGFEVCRRLKANPRTTEIPVVMVTALSAVSDRVRGLEAGADDFLTKPVDDLALFARLRSLVRLRRMMEEWRLREDICGQFGGGAGADEDAGPARILIVEPDDFAAARMTEALLPIAHGLERVRNCAEARQKLEGGLELVIAGMSSRDDPLRLVSECRAEESVRQVPILLVADDGDMPRLVKGLDLGANDYVIRPVDRNELLARARTQIRRKRVQDRLKENYRRSLSLALTDELTGLYNRRYALVHLDELVARVNAGADGTALLVIDVDHFKQVNDTHGHDAGDDVLRQLAARLQHGVRNFDLVARLGGEEFVVVMPEANLAFAAKVADRLRHDVAAEPFTITASGTPLAVTISLGVTIAEPGDDRARLLKRADDALYAAKAAGRNRAITRIGGFTPLAAAS